MQFDFFFPLFRRNTQAEEQVLQIGSTTVPLRFIRNDAARRYILRINEEGCARVTVPRRGSIHAAREFALRQLPWIQKQLLKREAEPTRPIRWGHGTDILFQGEKSAIVAEANGLRARFADQVVELAKPVEDFRPAIEGHLRRLAERELTARTWELAALHQLSIRRVAVRGQRSRWGSCSTKKTISLNWRLIQTPAFVSDYIILHELMHLREMNHSRRFWRQVESVCPDYARAEAWLKRHEGLLRSG
jgi:predicted metal-dependent hydrolase